MIKPLLTLLAVTALSANAQIPTPPKVTEAVPEKSTTTSTTIQTDSTVTEVVPVATPTAPRLLPAPRPSTAAPPAPRANTVVVPAAPVPAAEGSSINKKQDQPIVVRRLDDAVARRHLLVTPQIITITPEQRTALNRTVTIDSRPVRRAYNTERNVVIVEEQGQSRELPYLTVPVLFVVNSAELLDAESRDALTQTAALIHEVTKTNPSALFDVEGHTSEEGSAEHNMLLSVERSKRIYAELTQRYGVPATALTAHGYGQNFAIYPNGTERERQEDRRVLVVRTR